MSELLLDEGSDPGFGEIMSGITPFQRIHIVNNSRHSKNIYSTRLILKMLKSPSRLDFSKNMQKSRNVSSLNHFLRDILPITHMLRSDVEKPSLQLAGQAAGTAI